MAKTIVVGNPIRVNGAKPLDALYGPYNNITEALAAIPSSLRFIGRTVCIVTDNIPAEYWFSGGISDSNLITKSSGESGSGDIATANVITMK